MAFCHHRYFCQHHCHSKPHHWHSIQWSIEDWFLCHINILNIWCSNLASYFPRIETPFLEAMILSRWSKILHADLDLFQNEPWWISYIIKLWIILVADCLYSIVVSNSSCSNWEKNSSTLASDLSFSLVIDAKQSSTVGQTCALILRG